MRADHIHMACQNARLTPRLTPHLIQGSATAWRVCACVIDRSFVVIRLKHLAV